MKPFSQACENNKQPIAQTLAPYLQRCHSVLEVGSGTGQHAVYLAQHFPHLQWQCSDLAVNHPGICMWLDEAGLSNVQTPVLLDVSGPWPTRLFDAVFSANTLHIMPWDHAPDLFRGAATCLPVGGLLAVYGPFNYQGAFTSASNERFDQWLRTQHPLSGIRDVEAVHQLAMDNGFTLVKDHAMPANNRLIVWEKT